MTFQYCTTKVITVSSLGIVLLAYLFSIFNPYQTGRNQFDVHTVLKGLLDAEAGATVRPGAKVAVGFGGCLDRLGNSLEVLSRLEATVPDVGENVNELSNREDLEKTFAYYFSNGASAGRTTKNESFFTEVEHAFLSSVSTRSVVGGNAPVMAKRFHAEGVEVVLGARMSAALRQQIDPQIRIVGDPIEIQDTHLIMEYEKGDKWGPYVATRANRFIVYNSVGQSPFMSLLDEFSVEVTRWRPAILVVGGLRLLLGADDEQAVKAPSLATRLSQTLTAVRGKTRIHVELSSFPNPAQLSLVIDNALRHADSIGLNEQELPALLRHLRGSHQHGGAASSSALPSSENSHPSVRTTLDHSRSLFRFLRHMAPIHERRFSRLHVHTLAFQLIMVEAGGGTTAATDLWPNGRAAVAKAALTANRHTCGSNQIDVSRAKLLLDSVIEISDTEWLELSGQNPVACWTESAEHGGYDVDVEICLAPVIVCTNVTQTVGGGDNVSAAGLVLQI
jgi:ADP-dependent glucokinase